MDYTERFRGKVNKDGRNNKKIGKCWEWTAGLVNGYGHFKLNGTKVLAHRLSYVLHHPLTIELLEHREICVCHKCDNPRCVNPAHLFLGSQVDNIKDREAKGRGNHPKGEKHGRSKLTEEQVREIRIKYANGGITHLQLALEYGISQQTITKIILRKYWSHI